MVFTFSAEDHTYRIDGQVVPSITGLIKPLVNFSMIPQAILQKAADYGTAVHKVVELHHAGTLDMETLDPALHHSVAEYSRFEAAHPHLVGPFCELPMPHVKQMWAGTPDLIFDALAYVEVKTRKTNRLTDPIQLAAQDMLWIANGGTKAEYTHHVLELIPNQPYKLVDFSPKEMKEAKSRFRYLLDYHKMKTNINSWGKE